MSADILCDDIFGFEDLDGEPKEEEIENQEDQEGDDKEDQ
jgi:hypothetical protein